MKRTFSVFLALSLFLATTHRLPAPIQEVPESPTPKPEQSAKPKRTVKPKASESSESSTKRQTPSPIPKNQSTPNRNPFDGTWVGIFKAIPFKGDIEFTFTITGTGKVVSARWSTDAHTYQSTCDGTSVKWTDTHFAQPSPWHTTFTPNSDGRTAVVACDNEGGFLGIGAYSSSVIFRRTSP
jgi:hypothetical protein